ncbi:hypothetical protein V6N11_010870 [Hibiscus sabdariffa]|uniref:Uncharacterized protein n=1 Tax=Hibiscus sabdariffa TaxID=183260 RepID=A0ABR2S721_9ROSI
MMYYRKCISDVVETVGPFSPKQLCTSVTNKSAVAYIPPIPNQSQLLVGRLLPKHSSYLQLRFMRYCCLFTPQSS